MSLNHILYLFLVFLLSRNKTTFSSGYFSDDLRRSMNIISSSDKAVDGSYNGDLMKGEFYDKFHNSI